MIYRIKLDGVDIYGNSEDTALLSPTVNIELNNAGSLEFKMPHEHKNYDSPKLLTSDIDVYEDDDLIWYGRIIEINTAMNKDKSIVCEGPLAFFNDSIQRPQIFDTTSVSNFFETVIANHNAQVPPNRQFVVGNITVDDVEIYRELNYEKTKDVIENMCLNAEGGYLFFRKNDEGENVVDWLAEMPYDSTQNIQFGLNIVDISQHVTGSDIRTAILPLGKEVNGARVTLADLETNNGYDYIESDTVGTYGTITEVVEFDDIGTADELYSAAQAWLYGRDGQPLTIECDAAELHYLDNSYPPYRVGQNVRVKSIPHNIDQVLPITAININLDSAVKKITVGTQEKRELTEIYKQSDDSYGSSSRSSGSSSSGSSGGSGSSIVIDNAMSGTSTNPVQNKVVKAYVDAVSENIPTIDSEMSGTSTNPVQNKIVKAYVDAVSQNIPTIDTEMSDSSTNPVQNKVIYEAISEIPRGDQGYSLSASARVVTGGYELTIYSEDPNAPNVVMTLENGADGVDGTDGVNGTNGTDGRDGYSLYVSDTPITDGHRLTFTSTDPNTSDVIVDLMNGADGVDGTDGINGSNGTDGQDGADGYSISASRESITGGNRITITSTDPNTADVVFDVMDGIDGTDGTNGTNGTDGEDGYSVSVSVSEITGGHSMTVSSTDPNVSDQTFNIMDGTTTIQATSLNREISLPASGWTGASAPYVQTVTYTSMTADVVPEIGLVVSSDIMQGLEQQRQWSFITRAESGVDTITFYCYKTKPTVNLTAIVKVV